MKEGTDMALTREQQIQAIEKDCSGIVNLAT